MCGSGDCHYTCDLIFGCVRIMAASAALLKLKCYKYGCLCISSEINYFTDAFFFYQLNGEISFKFYISEVRHSCLYHFSEDHHLQKNSINSTFPKFLIPIFVIFRKISPSKGFYAKICKYVCILY